MKFMETLLKLGFSIVVICAIYYEAVFLWTLWKSQLDPKATTIAFAKKLKPKNDIVVFRENKKIYQNGVVVGDISGEVTATQSGFIFTSIDNTGKLDRSKPFEYGRALLKIVSVAKETGLQVRSTEGDGTRQALDVLEDITTEKAMPE